MPPAPPVPGERRSGSGSDAPVPLAASSKRGFGVRSGRGRTAPSPLRVTSTLRPDDYFAAEASMRW